MLLRLIICLISFLSVISAQSQIPHQENRIEGCLKRYFSPAWVMDSESQSEMQPVRCSKPSPQLCDISYAISHRNYEGIKCLIDADYDFNVESGKFDFRDIPIMNAAYYDADMLSLLLQSRNPIDLKVKNKSNQLPLNFLISQSYTGVVNRGQNFSWEQIYKSVEILLKEGADANASINGTTLLISKAKETGTARYIILLLQYGADPNIQSPEGETALMLSDDDPDKIKHLIKTGADIYIQDKNGNTAIFYAIKNCQINKIEALLEKDKNIMNSKNKKGRLASNYLKKQILLSGCQELRQFYF